MNKPIKHVLEDDTIEYRLPNWKFHRTGGPAVICPDGGQYWYQNGVLHREDGPAVIHSNGRKTWFRYGKVHRTQGPAAVFSDGTEYWFLNGKLHREDGPAVIKPHKQHSDNGVAIQYWIDGIKYDPVTYLVKCYERTN
jgi:hypothetical protein